MYQQQQQEKQEQQLQEHHQQQSQHLKNLKMAHIGMVRADALGNMGNQYIEIPETTVFCSKCSRKFKYRHNLLQHEKYHIDGKKFCCGKCSRGFTRRYDMTRHERICRMIELEDVQPINPSSDEAN